MRAVRRREPRGCALLCALLAYSSVAVTSASFGCGPAACPEPARRFRSGPAIVEHHARLLAWAETLRAEARVDRRESGAPAERARLRGTVYMMAERPDRVRFDVMTQFGPAAILTSDAGSFALTDLREQRFLVGPSCAESVALLLGLPMEAEQVGRLLFGEAPRIDGEEHDVTCENGRYRVEVRGPDGSRQSLAYEVRAHDLAEPPESQRLRLRETSVRGPDGAEALRIRWDDHRFVPDPRSEASPPEGIALPHRIHIELPREGIDVLVRLERIEINVDLPDDAFRQEPRPGLEIEPVECGAP